MIIFKIKTAHNTAKEIVMVSKWLWWFYPVMFIITYSLVEMAVSDVKRLVLGGKG